MAYNPRQFSEKYQLALESALDENQQSGLCGFELEWNLLDGSLRPLLTIGSGPNRRSFVEYLRSEVLSPWVRDFSQLEVFHWMIEWVTRPYFTPRGAVYEARLLEGLFLNALYRTGSQFGEELYAWHGNLLFNTHVGHHSIPDSWDLAKKRYLERCVDMYGDSLATAGTHTNLSLPEPMLAWDFIHMSTTERGDLQLIDYKNQFYITATRLMRAFAALFVATSASTPLQAQLRDGRPVVAATKVNSIRNLTFPNPPSIDLPDLYRSYDDYLRISYDLVRRGVRIGNNNWTPVRARSFAESVERQIAITSEQLGDLYARGIYVIGQDGSTEEMASQIEVQNLLARINIPMSRVEIRTDDGGHPLEVDIANLTLKHLLLLRIYADPEFARAFRYDQEDIGRARRNEELAARYGLNAQIENPLTGKPVGMREFLGWTLSELSPLADLLGVKEDLEPLAEMVAGAPNTAERIRDMLCDVLGDCDEVPIDLLRELAEQRVEQLTKEVSTIAEHYRELQLDATKLGECFQHARDDVRLDPKAPISFRPRPEALTEFVYADKTSEILALAKELIRIPSVTACPDERLDDLQRAGTLIFEYVRNRGLGVRYYDQYKYPALLIGFPGHMHAPVMFAGHFDVVPPEPDDSQFEPHVDGDYLWGRGAADMKTVVATYLVWMKDMLNNGSPYPPINLLLVGNEENGEVQAMGTPHVLRLLSEEDKYQPKFVIAGERTEERGDRLWGEICTQNRGIIRFDISARGQKGHSGDLGVQEELSERLFQTRRAIQQLSISDLTINGMDGWQSQVRFPFIQLGSPGVYNITPDYGLMGVEVRPIPQDNPHDFLCKVSEFCSDQDLEMNLIVNEAGIACNPENPFLTPLIRAVRSVSREEPIIGRKLPATSARFAPNGQGVVWGQSGIGPHSNSERHFIPSIKPYYRALVAYSDLLKEC
jgi:succinyl-diaminopimelate desuccinylase